MMWWMPHQSGPASKISPVDTSVGDTGTALAADRRVRCVDGDRRLGDVGVDDGEQQVEAAQELLNGAAQSTHNVYLQALHV